MSSFFGEKWSPEAIKYLEGLVADGKSAGQASRELSERYGLDLSRNSVISQCARRRWKLKGKRQGGRPKGTSEAPKKAKKEPEKKPVLCDLRKLKNEPAALGDVAGGCAWLHGDPLDRNFCGHERKAGSSYCAHHKERAASRVQRTEKTNKRIFKGINY